MKLGMNLYSFNGDIQPGKMSVDDALRYCAELGCDGIELIAEQHLPLWPYMGIDDLDHFRDLCGELGLEIFCFSCYFNSLNRSDREATFEEYLDMVKRSVSACAHLGAKLFRPAFYAVPVDKMVDLVKASLPILEKYGVVWGTELHAPFPPEYYLGALKAVNSPWFRLIPDFSCWQTAGAAGHFQANDVSTLEPLLEYTVHCHGKAHVFDENGEEPNTPYKDIMQKLKDYGFEGSVAGEFEGWIFDDYRPSKEVCKTHFELLKRYGR